MQMRRVDEGEGEGEGEGQGEGDQADDDDAHDDEEAAAFTAALAQADHLLLEGRSSDKAVAQAMELLLDLRQTALQQQEEEEVGRQRDGTLRALAARRLAVSWRLCSVCRALVSSDSARTDRGKCERVLRAAAGYAEEAIEAGPEAKAAHKWSAIVRGELSKYLPTKERIEGGHLVREHIRAALLADPEDAAMHFMLGKVRGGGWVVGWSAK